MHADQQLRYGDRADKSVTMAGPRRKIQRFMAFSVNENAGIQD